MEWANYVESLRAKMRRHRISQCALSRALGCKPPQVNRWLCGRAVPTLKSVSRIEAAIKAILQERKDRRLARATA